MRSVRRVVHLVVRFVTSLFARTPGERDMEWVRATLGGPEFAIWATMGRADRAESVAVARRAEAVGVRPVGVAAALVHDVGKQRSGLSTLSRALVTALDALAPRRLAAASSRSRAARAAQQYLDHAELGAQALAESGARPELVGWARAHHRPETWPSDGLSLEECQQLARADGEV